MSKPAYYNDIDPYCCAVLRRQIRLGNLPAGDVDERDIRKVQPDDLQGYGQVHLFAGIGGFPLGLRRAGVPDDFPVWTGGFPCQDISVAGRGAGIGGERSGLWRDFARLIQLVRPAFVLVENVPALLGRGMATVLGDLAEIGYDAEWHCISAAAVGAPHIRERIFLLAYPDSAQRWETTERRAITDRPNAGWQETPGGLAACRSDGGKRDVADSNGERLDRWRDEPEAALQPGRLPAERDNPWTTEPAVGRMAYGIPGRVDRLRGLGNAVVPQVAAVAARRMMDIAARRLMQSVLPLTMEPSA